MPMRPLTPEYFRHVQCDMRLPEAALAFRRANGLTSLPELGAMNITAWLFRDEHGAEGVQVNPNITIDALRQQFGPPDSPDAEVGIHSEMQAAEWFRLNQRLHVRQIFTERIPCVEMCAPMLRSYFPGVPYFYYYNRSAWQRRGRGGLVKTAAAVLRTAYFL